MTNTDTTPEEVQTALNAFDEALTAMASAQSALNDAHSKLLSAGQGLRQAVAKGFLPDEIIYARLQRILDAMKQYGRLTSIQIFTDGSLTVDTEAEDGFWAIISRDRPGGYRNIKELLNSNPETDWFSPAEVNRMWGAHKPTPRNGDYRNPDTWQFGKLKGGENL